MDDLNRFLIAQEPLFPAVVAELTAGVKRTHWMWFVFPQLRGLGSSPRAHVYGIGSLNEAQAYLAHPVLGKRLSTCTSLVLATRGKTLHEIFGAPDDVKFHSSMTLFSVAADDSSSIFDTALVAYFDGKRDERTLALLGSSGAGLPAI